MEVKTHELKKYAYRQTKDGNIISFVMHPNEDTQKLAAMPIGGVIEITIIRYEE